MEGSGGAGWACRGTWKWARQGGVGQRRPARASPQVVRPARQPRRAGAGLVEETRLGEGAARRGPPAAVGFFGMEGGGQLRFGDGDARRGEGGEGVGGSSKEVARWQVSMQMPMRWPAIGGRRVDRVGGGLDDAAGLGLETDADRPAGSAGLGQAVRERGRGGPGPCAPVRAEGCARPAGGWRCCPGRRRRGGGRRAPGQVQGVGEPFGSAQSGL